MPFWAWVRANASLYVAEVFSSSSVKRSVVCNSRPSGAWRMRGGPFVHGVVNLGVLALQFPVPLPTKELPQEIDPNFFSGAPVTERQAAAVRTESFVDQRGGGRPMGTVEHHLVQRGQNALEGLAFTHRHAFARPRSVGPIPIGSGRRSPPAITMCFAASPHADVAGPRCQRR